MFHLGWFTNFMPPKSWRGQWGGHDAEDWASGSFYIDFARSLERACFDYIMLEDSLMVPDAYGGTAEFELKHSLYAPKHDPVHLVPLLAAATERLGIFATMSTSFYPPYMLARSLSTLSHLTDGRVGWNIVTSSEHRAAQNFGMDELWQHDDRYDRADEFLEVAELLWESWDEDAVVLDRDTWAYADHSKVRSINFKGRYYNVRGPLNTLPPRHGRPVYCQAGGSPRGREFAARHADTVITSAIGIPAMKEYRDDVRSRAERFGRDPDSIKLMFLLTPILGDTEAEARSIAERRAEVTDWSAESSLVNLAAITENDFSVYDLDGPVPDLHTNGHQSSLADFSRSGRGQTLRDAAAAWGTRGFPAVGTPDQVAERMGEVMDEIGGDGYLISNHGLSFHRRYIGEITEGLVPALQRMGLTRTGYEHPTFRQNLLAF